MYQDKVDQLKADITQAQAGSPDELEIFRMKYISKKSIVGELFAAMRDIPNEQKRAYGQAINEVKQLAEDKFQELIEKVNSSKDGRKSSEIDLTLPASNVAIGGIHPLTSTRQRIIEIFERIGFNLSEGPEIEDDWHNFTALNFSENHRSEERRVGK